MTYGPTSWSQATATSLGRGLQTPEQSGGWSQTCNPRIPLSKPDGRYTENGDGTVTDMWKQCAEGQSNSDNACLRYRQCSHLHLEGCTGTGTERQYNGLRNPYGLAPAEYQGIEESC